jgi:ATPase subunit of ABC transporter with duplicated ATPase domains
MIILKNLTKSTHEKELFRDFSLTINTGDRIGIVGQNGCGKSTLLRIIAGEDIADSGSIDRAQEQIFSMPQSLVASDSTTVEQYLDPGEYPDVWRRLSEVDLSDLPLNTPIAQLSGGQKTKLLLIKTFAMPSTTLLLDEPTNHLDTSTRQWLLKQISAYRGSVVMVSHDRAFLNTCATKMIEIDSANHDVKVFSGNYDIYKKEKALWMERRADEYKLQQRKKKEMLEWIALKRQEATVFSSPAKGKQLRQMEHRFEREIVAQEIAQPKSSKEMAPTALAGNVHAGKIILRLLNATKQHGDKAVLHGVTFEVRGNTRIRLAGENGSGKSTLLRLIVGDSPPDTGTVTVGDGVRIGYFAQQLETLNENASILETFTNIPSCPLSEYRARAILGAFLFSGESIFKKIRNLSYGERVRLQLAMLFQKKYELLILDEPTNHLDIPSREVVEAALRAYEGALIVVSHDEYFLQSIGIDRELVLKNGHIDEKF